MQIHSNGECMDAALLGNRDVSDSKGKNYSLHGSSENTESTNLNEAQLRTPLENTGADESPSKPATSSVQPEQFAAFLGNKPIDNTPAVQPDKEKSVEAKPTLLPKNKFYGRLVI